MQIFYAKDYQETNALPEEESKHALRVLRKKIGDVINVTNGKGAISSCEITDVSGKICKFKILSTEEQANANPNLHIAIAPTKNIDRFEFFLEKATEIGVNTITPLLGFHSERKNIKMERLNKIIISACKQSKNFHFPILNDLTAFNEILEFNSDQKLIAHCEEKHKTQLKELSFEKDTLLLIGPEGDFSSEEIERALESKFHPISLGESRLRTETAGIVAVTTVNLKLND